MIALVGWSATGHSFFPRSGGEILWPPCICCCSHDCIATRASEDTVSGDFFSGRLTVCSTSELVERLIGLSICGWSEELFGQLIDCPVCRYFGDRVLLARFLFARNILHGIFGCHRDEFMLPFDLYLPSNA